MVGASYWKGETDVLVYHLFKVELWCLQGPIRQCGLPSFFGDTKKGNAVHFTILENNFNFNKISSAELIGLQAVVSYSNPGNHSW